MSYSLGIDLGSTSVTAATCAANECELVPIDPSRYSLLGGSSHPNVPLLVTSRGLGHARNGGDVTASESVIASLIDTAIDEAIRGFGPPAAIVLAHPGSWGPSEHAVLMAALGEISYQGELRLMPGPEAVVAHHGAAGSIPTDQPVAVLDMGGGRTELAVVGPIDEGGLLLGDAVGRDGLGGLAFNQMLFERVRTAAGIDALAQGAEWVSLDQISTLRTRCRTAKEQLSSAPTVAIDVAVGTVAKRVKIERHHFEDLIEASVDDAVNALAETIEDSGIDPSDLAALILTGGSSRIPLLRDRAAARTGLRTLADAEPESAVAFGAARSADPRPPLPHATAPVTPAPITSARPTGRTGLRLVTAAASMIVLAVAIVAGLRLSASTAEDDRFPNRRTTDGALDVLTDTTLRSPSGGTVDLPRKPRPPQRRQSAVSSDIAPNEPVPPPIPASSIATSAAPSSATTGAELDTVATVPASTTPSTTANGPTDTTITTPTTTPPTTATPTTITTTPTTTTPTTTAPTTTTPTTTKPTTTTTTESPSDPDPSGPVSVESRPIGENAVQIAWEADDGGYGFVIKLFEEQRTVRLETVDPEVRQVQFNGLAPATTYDFEVASFSGDSESGSITTGGSGPGPNAPPGPIQVEFTFTGSDSVELTWRVPSGDPSPIGFLVQVVRRGHFQELHLGADARGATFGGLRPGEEYSYLVASKGVNHDLLTTAVRGAFTAP